jgi:hypothetical protein
MTTLWVKFTINRTERITYTWWKGESDFSCEVIGTVFNKFKQLHSAINFKEKEKYLTDSADTESLKQLI